MCFPHLVGILHGYEQFSSVGCMLNSFAQRFCLENAVVGSSL